MKSDIPLSRKAPTGSVLGTIRNLWSHLSARYRRLLMLMPVPMLAAALAETASLSLMLPFLAVLAAPDKVFAIPLVRDIATALGIDTPQALLPVLTVTFVVVVLGAAVLRMVVAWANSRLAYAIGEDMAMAVFSRTLHQPYQVHAQRNSATVQSALVKIKATSVTLVTALAMLSSILIAIFIIGSLMAINPKIALGSFVVLGSIYGLITYVARKRLARNSRVASSSQTAAMQTVDEALGAIRDVILDGSQAFFLNDYYRSTHAVARAQGNSYFLSYSPRYAVEGIGMTIFVGVAYLIADQSGGFAAALPLLGTFALGAQRLMPVLQQIYVGWATLKSNQATLQEIVKFLDQAVGTEYDRPSPPPVELQHGITFEGVGFRYHADGPLVVRDLNFAIEKGQRVGFLGSTGSGKSTTFDLLMGLLPASEGRILIDGQPLTADNRRAWQRAIAHVPQSIYLSDTTMAGNIAFGVPAKEIDMDRVREAAAKAHIADFIESQAGGYLAQVGERGIRISGGQRQRIGIARALYRDAQVLVFDEATSALDHVTEKAVMDAIEGLGRELTIFMIAHRLSTLSGCDLVLELERGELTAAGSYDALAGHRSRQAS